MTRPNIELELTAQEADAVCACIRMHLKRENVRARLRKEEDGYKSKASNLRLKAVLDALEGCQ